MARLTDEEYMKIAIDHTKTNPVWPFAALLVDSEGNILMKGINRMDESPTFHGEIVAINEFAKKFPGRDMSNLTLYTTGEPCAMCAGACCWASIKTVVYGSSVPFLNKLWGIDVGIRAEEIFARNTQTTKPIIVGPILEDECNQLFITAKALQENVARDAQETPLAERTPFEMSRLRTTYDNQNRGQPFVDEKDRELAGSSIEGHSNAVTLKKVGLAPSPLPARTGRYAVTDEVCSY